MSDEAGVELAGDSSEAHQDSYDVAAFVRARRHLHVVDNWVAQTRNDGATDAEFEALRRDGVLLVEAFERQSARDELHGHGEGLGATMAVQEVQQLLELWEQY